MTKHLSGLGYWDGFQITTSKMAPARKVLKCVALLTRAAVSVEGFKSTIASSDNEEISVGFGTLNIYCLKKGVGLDHPKVILSKVTISLICAK